ncbi:MAG: outer membrane lipoprotein carrier protein LolA [Epulopiscium sp.]|nr:outer membrane lipoprotein carrier protein LolA [Candidatus Epulonipiscium sp.]
MKKLKALFLAVTMGCVILTSCAPKKVQKSPIEEINDKLMTMETYGCIADLTYISNKGENTYKTKQYYRTTGEYRVEMIAPEEVKGLVTVYDGEKVMQYNPRINGEVIDEIPESKNRNEIFLGVFLKNYLQSEEVTLEVFNINDEEYSVLEAVIPEGGKYLATEKLWVSNKTLEPNKLIVYDIEGKERIIVKYEQFKYNIKLEDRIFRISKSNEGQ